MPAIFAVPPKHETTRLAAESMAQFRYDPERYCEKCGYVGLTFVEDTSEFQGGWYRTEECECSRAQHARLVLEEAGVPVAYLKATLQTWNNTGRIDRERQQNEKSITSARAVAARMDEATRDGLNLWIYGAGGAGKTWVACSLLRDAILRWGLTGKFASAGSLVRDSINHREEFETLHYADWLVIDAVDALPETRTGYEIALVEDLLRSRVQNKKPMIFTAGCTVEKMPARFVQSVGSLISTGALPLVFEGAAFGKGAVVQKWQGA